MSNINSQLTFAERYNGLVYLSEKFKGDSLCWQITLDSKKSVRGELAQAALNVLN